MRAGRAVGYMAVGMASGVVLGALLTTVYQERNAQALFSPHRRRRWAALGRLAADAAVDNVPLVREYVAWEQHPGLRRRGERLLHRLQTLHG
jgi:hypothetical protein